MEPAASTVSILDDLHEKHKARQARIKAAAFKALTEGASPIAAPPQEPVSTIAPLVIPNQFEIILTEFCDHFKVRREDIMSARRLNYIATHRQLLIYMMYWLTDYTNYKIGAKINRDPSTVLYAIKKIQSNLPLHRKDIEELEARIKPLLPQKRKP